MEKLTFKEQEMLDYINQVIRRSGYSPSVRDIQEALGIKSTSTVHAYIDKLVQKGYIRKSPGKSRTIRTSEVESKTTGESVKIPLVGQVAAGTPILAVENIERHIDFQFTGKSYNVNDLFALKVRGNSMINAGINTGDIIIVKKQGYAENGQMVVALLEDEATVKTFYREKDHIRLQPENDTMQPILTKEVMILGRVIAAIKYFD
ncbi:MAG: transcriptional repressor LexA [Clostridia bacterium]|nr:transcriptional repressor LexA [Clostridia bacterium]